MDQPHIVVLFNHETKLARGEGKDLIALQDTISTTHYICNALISLGYQTSLISVTDSLADLAFQLSKLSPSYTFIFNNCDGFAGRNLGAVQVLRIVENMGFCHTGASADVIAQCIDKSRAKNSLLNEGLPTPAFRVFGHPSEACTLRFPAIVKPLTEDGSIGIDDQSVVSNTEELQRRIEYILKSYDQPALVEEFIVGREFAVSLWGNENLEILPIYEEDYSKIEDPLKHLLTFDSKWIESSWYYHEIEIRCPAILSRKEENYIKQISTRTYYTLSLRDFARFDIRYDGQTAYVVDANELPDLSPDAGFTRTAMVAGYSYEDIIEKILHFALKREGWR